MDEVIVNEILNEPLNEFEKRGYTIVGYERKLKVNYSFYQELVNNKLTKLGNYNNNILIIHEDADTTASTMDSINFAKENNIKIVKGADHRFKKSGELDKVIELKNNFICL